MSFAPHLSHLSTERTNCMLAQFSIYPMDRTHMSKDVAKVIEVLEAAGLNYKLGPLATSVEGEWAAIIDAIRQCHNEVIKTHRRVLTTILIDDNNDQELSLDEAVAHVEQH